MMKKWRCFMFLSIMTLCDASKLNLPSKNIETKKALSHLNRIPVKTIKSPDGDIVDCINIYEQPAFDHPLLKNHTIRRRPSYDPLKNLSPESKIFNFTVNYRENKQPWQLNGRCPKGTIPILRIAKEDALRYGKKTHKSNPQPSVDDEKNVPNLPHEHVVVQTQQAGTYRAGYATINVWQPNVEKNWEFSLSQISLYGGPANEDNTIETGWMVYPRLYKDRETRFFVYWTRDNYRKTGCYNLLCPGFIQTNPNYLLGGRLLPTSVYYGRQAEIYISVAQDPSTGDWWLHLGKNTLGYWPASIVPHLTNGASKVDWGGEVVNDNRNGHHTTTQMGSGQFAERMYCRASYFRHILVTDGSYVTRSPGNLVVYDRQPRCYNIQVGHNPEAGQYFYYGGPGKSDQCL